MQDIAKQVFLKAKEELPHLFINYLNEESLLYNGFKVSYSYETCEYYWKHIRDSAMYSDVDPLITEQVLKKGLVITLKEVAHHRYKQKLVEIDRELMDIAMQNEYWIYKANENYFRFKEQKEGISNNSKLDSSGKRYKLSLLNKKYLKNKKLYEKKRKVLKEEKADIMANKVLYMTKLKQ